MNKIMVNFMLYACGLRTILQVTVIIVGAEKTKAKAKRRRQHTLLNVT